MDFQAGVEDVFLWLSVALAGAHGLVASSFVGGSRVLSPAKVVLDADAIRMMQHVLAGAAVDDESALLDDIAEVGPGGHFLGRNSTRARARSGELFEPRALRRARADSRLDTALATDAAERARAILETHEVLPLPDEAARLVDEVIASGEAAAASGEAALADASERGSNQECLTLVWVRHRVWRNRPARRRRSSGSPALKGR